MKKNLYGIITIVMLIFGPVLSEAIVYADSTAEIRTIFFPTEPTALLTESFGDGRYDHFHEGEDIMGEKMMPLYAAVDGIVSGIEIPEASWGYAVTIKDSEGYTYHYLHINNDTPGTDDGQGGVINAYAPGVSKGAKIVKGQLIGWMGDSGNAESVGPHLHFEIREPDKTAIDPYPSLAAALYPNSYNPAEASGVSLSINMDKNLSGEVSPTVCVSGSLIKLDGMQTVYYCGADGRRYVFPNDKTYFTWYDNFGDVDVLSLEEIAEVPLGGNVTYRPGIKMVKIQTDPKVYAVAPGGVLRWIQSAETAELLYGVDWNKKIDDIPDSFFVNYRIGETILSLRP